MVRSKPKKEKREETTAEFVLRMNLPEGKRKGLKRRFTWQKRRHPGHK